LDVVLLGLSPGAAAVAFFQLAGRSFVHLSAPSAFFVVNFFSPHEQISRLLRSFVKRA
jgi:hypothetical protein